MLRRIGRLCYLVQTFAVRLACLWQASRAAAAPPPPRGRALKINGKCGRILRPLAFFTTAAIKNPPPKGVIFAILP